MTDTFTPPKCPVQGTAKDVTAGVKIAQFGDNYSQRAKDGLNSIGRGVTLNWQGLTHAEAQAIEDFFEAKGGAEAFYYQPLTVAAPLKWTCAKWQRTSQGYRESVAATFNQVFDL